MRITGQLKAFASSLKYYITEFEDIMINISRNLPAVEHQIDFNLSGARQQLDLTFSASENQIDISIMAEEIAKGIKKIKVLGKLMDSQINILLSDFEPDKSRNLIIRSAGTVKNFSFILNDLLTRIESVKAPIYSIMIELQKQDIIQQQMNHLMDAMNDILYLIDADNASGKDLVHINTLLKVLLLTLEKQLFRINKDLISMIDVIENQFYRIHTKIREISSDNRLFSQDLIQENSSEIDSINKLILLAHAEQFCESQKISDQINFSESLLIIKKREAIFSDNYKSIMNITEILSSEIPLYTSYFEKLRLLYSDMNNKIEICTNMRIDIEQELEKHGGPLNINDCHFKDVILNKIIKRCTVLEERETLLKEFPELVIETSSRKSITLF